ncbi:MAG: hypothetical protein IPL53_21105 [Ignavibacteria bacterium]|nr:hypothetical protein [Ignavibacteria bacterium]
MNEKANLQRYNRAVESATSEILVFSDANTLLNIDLLKCLTRHYTDNKIGAVSGEKIVSSDDNEGDVKSEGLYWKYESFLKKLIPTVTQ